MPKPKKTRTPHKESSSFIRRLLRLGPGVVTGAADDDPSGIATCSQAGAQFGLGVLWMSVFSYPLMCAVQEVSARIGRVTGAGISANLLKTYPRPVAFAIVLLLLVSSIFNLGADLGAMGEATHMLFGGRAAVHVVWLGLGSLLLQVFVRYTSYVKYLKWLALSIFAYVVAVFFVDVPWMDVLKASLLPPIKSFHGEYLTMIVAVFGTTISPYLFFWQASEEAEEARDHPKEAALTKAPEQAPEQLNRIRLDTYLGMAASQLVSLCIMLTSAVTLHVHGETNVQTASEAAKALEPLAGPYAYALFAAGIIGTGLLAVPVLAGSAAYAAGEVMWWRVGLQHRPRRAVKFYATLGAATLIGLSLNFVHLDPIKALFIAAVINGVLAAPVMAMMMLITQNTKLMGPITLPRYLRILGWAATVVMAIASMAFLLDTLLGTS